MPPLDENARARAADQDWELSLLDPLDPDERAIMIGLAHPQLGDAIGDGAEEVRVGGATMSPRLHLAIHEVVAQQLIDDAGAGTGADAVGAPGGARCGGPHRGRCRARTAADRRWRACGNGCGRTVRSPC
jgi:hypothetical protein